MKIFYLIVMLLFPVFFLVSCSSETDTVFINDVHDGDTIKSSTGEKFRIFGIDTPEVSSQGRKQFNSETMQSTTKWVATTGIEAMYGAEATKAARELLLNKDVTIIRITKGKYGRTVARVLWNNVDLGLMLVSRGLARVAYISLQRKNPYFTTRIKYYKELIEAQYHAAYKRLGIWRWEDKFKKIFPKS